MGALHDGHISLIKKSQSFCDYTVVSIFINPLQFSQNEDFSSYPKTIEADLNILKKLKIDVVFLPLDSIIYPIDFSTFVNEVTLSKVLEGNSRPNFFEGVVTVVIKLFNIIEPTHVFFGQKDAQQLIIIKKVIKDLAFNIELVSCPIIRDKNGLALSSRNQYLSDKDKRIACLIYKSLMLGKKLLKEGEKNPKKIKDIIIKNLKKNDLFEIDYISIADLNSLVEIKSNIANNILVSIAVIFRKKVRLIDNFYFSFD